MDLLFTLATWHAYAKLRLHTDKTLKSFETVTKTLGKQLRRFVKTTCAVFDTKELPKEVAARAKRAARQAAQSGSVPSANAPVTSGAKSKTFNLSTYKLHALGDYADTIRRFGTTDSYSTQMVCQSLHMFPVLINSVFSQGELEHRQAKRRFTRTNKHRFGKQLAQQDAREQVSKLVLQRINATRTQDPSRSTESADQDVQGHPSSSMLRSAKCSGEDSEYFAFCSPEDHHHIALSQKSFHIVPSWLSSHRDDPTIMVRVILFFFGCGVY
jgi:hypothetical protein